MRDHEYARVCPSHAPEVPCLMQKAIVTGVMSDQSPSAVCSNPELTRVGRPFVVKRTGRRDLMAKLP